MSKTKGIRNNTRGLNIEQQCSSRQMSVARPFPPNLPTYLVALLACACILRSTPVCAWCS